MDIQWLGLWLKFARKFAVFHFIYVSFQETVRIKFHKSW